MNVREFVSEIHQRAVSDYNKHINADSDRNLTDLLRGKLETCAEILDFIDNEHKRDSNRDSLVTAASDNS